MAWITLTDVARDTDVSPQAARLLPSFQRQLQDDALLASGSLFLEAEIGRTTQGDQTLFVLHRRADVTSHISVQLCADGTLVFARRLGPQNRQVNVKPGISPHDDGCLRMTVSWDCTARHGLISTEFSACGTVHQKEFSDPLPWLHSDIEALNHGGAEVTFGPALRCLGLSDRHEPVALTPSLAPGTPVLTEHGYVPVDDLCPDDIVLTGENLVPMPIRAICAREVPARGRFQPIRLNAPYLGLRQDVIVAPEQRLLITGAEVEYLFSQEAVLIEARDLLRTAYAVPQPVGSTFRYHQIVLDSHAMLNVAGSQMESLFIGALCDMPELLATTVLGSVPPSTLPRHKKLAFPALRDYEAITLRAALLSR